MSKPKKGRKKKTKTDAVLDEEDVEIESSRDQDEDGNNKDVDSPSSGSNKSIRRLARSALFAAVEGDPIRINDDDDVSSLYSPRDLVGLFEQPELSGNSHYLIKPGISMRDQKKALLETIRNFSKSDGRRYFAGLKQIVTNVIDSDEYAFTTGETNKASDDSDDANQKRLFTDDSDEEQSAEKNNAYNEVGDEARNDKAPNSASPLSLSQLYSLKFLHLAAISVQAFLDGCLEKRKQQQEGRRASTGSKLQQQQGQLVVIGEALDVAVCLHSILFELNSSQCYNNDDDYNNDNNNLSVAEISQTINSIVKLCESWWLCNGVQREQLIVQAIPLLTAAAVDNGLAVTVQKTAVKRLYKMRHALQLLDWQDDSSDAMRSLLASLVVSPCCSRLSEGKRLLAFLFHVDVVLLRDIHQAIRAQIPSSRDSLQKAYGDIYWTAWKEAPGPEERQLVEEEALQDLMYLVLHVANSQTAKSVRAVLEAIHCNKKLTEVEHMLHRMYGPILWRSLSAANAVVRVNAAAILAQVFPLQDKSHTKTKEAIQKGCEAVVTLLQDADPRVRVAGAQATASILRTYWNVLPADNIRQLLNRIVTEHASDGTSSHVRAGALNCITHLLEEPKSHAALRALLPVMGNLIHDRVQQVRLAAVHMLLRIKETPGIQYYHVVPVDHLTARLADEGRQHNNKTNAVASALTALMLNSYFPKQLPGKKQIDRTIAFLRQDPAAAAVFYANLHKHLPVTLVAKLAAMLLRCLHKAVETDLEDENNENIDENTKNKRKTNGRKRVRFDANKADNEQEQGKNKSRSRKDSQLSTSNTNLMAVIAETMSTLLESIEGKLGLAENDKCNQFLVDVFSGSSLTKSLVYFERKAVMHEQDSVVEESEADVSSSTEDRENCYRVCAAVLRSAGRLPIAAIDGLVPHVMSFLQSLSDESAANDSSTNHHGQNVSAHIALLCLWDMTHEVAPALARSIESGLEADHEILFASLASDTKKRKPRRSRSKKTQSNHAPMVVPNLPPSVALNVLGDLFGSSDPSCVAARESIFSSEMANQVIEQALERGSVYAERLLGADTSFSGILLDSDIDYILRVCELYGRFALHKEASLNNNNIHLSKQAEKILTWTTKKVVPAFRGPDSDIEIPFVDPELSSISLGKSLDSSTNRGNLPLSSLSNGPPRRKSSRTNTSPPRVNDDSSHAAITTNMPTNLVVHAFAVSTMQSSCIIFSEWLAVGAGRGAIDEIAKAAMKWTQIFKGKDTTTEKELLPAFTRLAVQLCKLGNNFSLLKELLIICHEDLKSNSNEKEQKPLRAGLVSLLSVRGNKSDTTLSETVQCVLDAAYHLIDQSDKHFVLAELPPVSEVMAGNATNIWPIERGFVLSGLSTIIANKQACLVLARRLVNFLNGDDYSTRSLKANVFVVNCLRMIVSCTGRKQTDLDAIVRNIDVSQLQGENTSEVHGAVNSLLSGLA